MMVCVYVIAITGLALVEGWPLIRRKKWKEATAFAVLLLAGLSVIVMDTVSFKPWRFATIIDYLFRPYSNIVKNFFLRF